MTHATDDRPTPSSLSANDRALEFDFSVRAPLRAHVARCVNAGWKPEEIALALAEIASEMLEDGDMLGSLPAATASAAAAETATAPASPAG